MGAVNAALKFLSEHQGVDYVAVPMDTCQEVKEFRRRLSTVQNTSNIKVVSKIDHKDGIDNFESILENSNAVMLIRCNLGT